MRFQRTWFLLLCKILNILKLPLRAEDFMDENVFENVFLPVGDYRDADIRRIVKPYLAE